MKLSKILAGVAKKSLKLKEIVSEVLVKFRDPFIYYHGYSNIYGQVVGEQQLPLFKQEEKVKHFPIDELQNLTRHLGSYIGFELSIDNALITNPEKYKLEVEGELLGEYTLLELRSIYRSLTDHELDMIYRSLPVRMYAEEEWKPAYQEGVNELPYLFKSPGNAGSRHSILDSITLVAEHQNSCLGKARLLDSKTYSSFLPESYKKTILGRKQAIISQIEAVMDVASFPIKSQEIAGRSILNFIHFGDTKGMQYYPY